MGRYRFTAFVNDSQPRYLVLWDLHWHVIECQRLEPDADLSGVMTATIAPLEGDGWQAAVSLHESSTSLSAPRRF